MCSSDLIRVWDVEEHASVAESFRGHTGGVDDFTYSPDYRHVVAGMDDGMIRMWDAQTRQLVGHSLFDPSGRVEGLTFSPDGHRIVATSSDSVRVWDVEAITGKHNVLYLHYEDKH